ncbi:RNA polymerase sigma factor [Microbulbifer sp. 2304DJ12-6]|uniref:RNA polymerase sigma factor n=1 Tax=Microbulbifer sp. 2304DJ12-6 TaxID=3233340 RepID=UPI0039AE9C17
MNQLSNLTRDLNLAQKGDKKAFSSLVGALTNTVHAIALAITKDLQHSHDVSQLVFIKIWQQLGELKNSNSLLPWVRQITRYTAINFIRDNKRQNETLCDDETLESLLDSLCNEEVSQDKSLISAQQNRVLNHLIDQLPDESREIVLLYYHEEYDSTAVAHLLGLTTSTVRKRLQRVRELLKTQILEKYGRVIFATAPVGLSATLTLTATSASPVAAATLSYQAGISQGHWFIKLFYILGGAGIGAFFGVLANSFGINRDIKNLDNQKDINTFQRLKRYGNLCIITCALALTASYQWTQGWLMPVITYSLFIFCLALFMQSRNLIKQQNLARRVRNGREVQHQLSYRQWACKFGYIIGVGGGIFGLIMGLYLSGRFQHLI